MSTSKQQLTRLLALVPYLQARQEVHLDEAAADFGVTPAQLRKDLNILWYCGYPGLGMGDLIEIDMEAVEGEGVIRLSNADYLKRPLRLSGTEAAAIMVALRVMREGADVEEAAVIDRTLAKIEEAAGDALVGEGALDVRAPVEAEGTPLASVVQEAVGSGRQLRLDYLSAGRDASTSRVVDPIGVYEWQGHTYLRAWCHQAEDQRTFRIDRVVAAEVLDSPAAHHEASEPLDLEAGVFSTGAEAPIAELTLTRDGRWVTEYYPMESVIDLPDGGVSISLRVHSREWLIRLLSRLGGSLVRVTPAGFADDLRAYAQRALDQY